VGARWQLYCCQRAAYGLCVLIMLALLHFYLLGISEPVRTSGANACKQHSRVAVIVAVVVVLVVVVVVLDARFPSDSPPQCWHRTDIGRVQFWIYFTDHKTATGASKNYARLVDFSESHHVCVRVGVSACVCVYVCVPVVCWVLFVCY
jgi:hypothetical protein